MKKSFILFFSFGVIARLFPLLLIPVITRLGDDTAVAEFMLFVSVSAFCSMFYLFGAQFELTRIFFATREEVRKNITNALFMITILGGGISFCINISGLDDLYLLASINGYLTAVVSYLLVYYRISGSVLKFGVVDVFRVGVQYVMMGVLLHYFQFDLLFILMSNLAWVLLLLAFECLRNKVTVNSIVEYIDRNEVKQSVVRGGSILPHSISIYALAFLDKVLLDSMASVSVLAQYSVGFVFGQTVLLVTDSFNKVWGPYAVKALQEGGRMQITKKSVILSIATILVAPVVGVIVYFVSRVYFPLDYSLSVEVAVLVSLIYVFQSIYFIVFPFLVQLGQVGRIGFITSISALFGAVVMFLLASEGYYSYLPLGMLVAFCGQVVGIVITVRKQ